MCEMPFGQPAPAPVENQGGKRPPEGGESGGNAQQPGYGAAVDAFNDMESARPNDRGNSNFDNLIKDLSDGFENGASTSTDKGGGSPNDNINRGAGESSGDNRNPGGDRGLPGDFTGTAGGSGNFPSAHETGGGLGSREGQDRATSLDSSSSSGQASLRDGSPESGSNRASQGDGQGEGRNPDVNSNNADLEPAKPSDKETGNTPKDVPKNIPKENPPGQATDKQAVPGDNMLSRLARGEPTEKDLQNLEKERVKQMYSGSAVPAFSGKGSSSGKGGSSHAEPKQTGPSPLTQYQGEAKAREAKWDAIQSWNHQAIRRAEAQDDQMRANLRKLNKG